MGFFNIVTEWKNQRFQNHMTHMKSIGKCPECNGSRITPTFRAMYTAPPLCPGCNGSGLFSDWDNQQP